MICLVVAAVIYVFLSGTIFLILSGQVKPVTQSNVNSQFCDSVCGRHFHTSSCWIIRESLFSDKHVYRQLSIIHQCLISKNETYAGVLK